MGAVATALSIAAFAPYIFDTITGETRPQRAAWLIWAVLSTISFLSNLYEGASTSAAFLGVQAGGTIIIAVLAIFKGRGTFLRRTDYAILFISGIGLVLWYHTDNAAYALAISLGLSMLAGFVTIIKSYVTPESETLSTWVISFFAAAAGIMAVGSNDPVLLAYPVYLFALYTCIITAFALGKLRLRRTANGFAKG